MLLVCGNSLEKARRLFKQEWTPGQEASFTKTWTSKYGAKKTEVSIMICHLANYLYTKTVPYDITHDGTF